MLVLLMSAPALNSALTIARAPFFSAADPTGGCCLELPSDLRGPDTGYKSLHDVGGHTCGFEGDEQGKATDDPKWGAPCNLHPAYWPQGQPRVEL